MGLSDNTTTAAAYGASLGTAAGASLTVNELAAVIGIALAVVTFVVNLVYKHLNYRLKKEVYLAEKQDY